MGQGGGTTESPEGARSPRGRAGARKLQQRWEAWHVGAGCGGEWRGHRDGAGQLWGPQEGCYGLELQCPSGRWQLALPLAPGPATAALFSHLPGAVVAASRDLAPHPIGLCPVKLTLGSVDRMRCRLARPEPVGTSTFRAKVAVWECISRGLMGWGQGCPCLECHGGTGHKGGLPELAGIWGLPAEGHWRLVSLVL